MRDILVSVVIPCYNHEKFVQDCIRSVINQTYQNIELIIIDDGSNDGSVFKIQEMIEECKLRFNRFEFRNRPNKGLSGTLNESLEWCKGEFLSILASDDIMLPHKTSIQIEYMIKEPSCAAVFGGAKLLKQDGTIMAERYSRSKKYIFKDIILNKYALFSPSQLSRVDIVRRVGGYDANIKLEDWYMNLKLTQAGYTLDSITELVVGYRRHDNNTSNNIGLLHDERMKILNIYKENKYYDAALIEFYYTKSKELVSESKTDSLKFLLISVYNNPRSLIRYDTMKTVIKIFLPNKILMAKRKGK